MPLQPVGKFRPYLNRNPASPSWRKQLSFEENLKKGVVDEIFWDDRVDASDVQVRVDGGSVTLTGTVPSYYAKRAAEWDARAVSGVVYVDNQLDVIYPTEVGVPTDEEIESHLRNKIAWDPSLDSSRIEVKVDSGRATLKGTVDAFWKKIRTENLAYETLGVVGVDDKLAVVVTGDYVDESIARDVVSALDRKAWVDATKIDVEVNNGIVSLSGTVPDWASYRSAMDAAEFTAGIRDVEDNLTFA